MDYENKDYENSKHPFRESKYLKPALLALGVVCGGIGFYYLLFNFDRVAALFKGLFSILTPFIIGGVLAYLLNPLLNVLEFHTKKWLPSKGLRRGVCIFFTYAIAIVIIWTLIAIVLPKLKISVQELLALLLESVSKASVLIIDWLNNSNFMSMFTQAQIDQIALEIDKVLYGVYNIGLQLIPAVLSLTSSLASTFFNFIVGFMVSIYLLVGKEKLGSQCKKTMYAWCEKKRADKTLDFFRLSDNIFGSFVVGVLIDAGIVGVLCFVLMSLFGMEYALLIGLIVAVTNIIPYFGPFIGAIPSILILLTVSTRQALGFGVLILVIQQMDGNIINPLVMGDSTGLSSIWIIFAVTVGGGLGGILGMVLGVPLCAIFYATFVSISNKQLERKGLSGALTSYALQPPRIKRKTKREKR